MSRSLRQFSSALAMVLLITSVINTVVVMCISGNDHHAIELIGHQEQHEGHITDTLSLTKSSIGHEAHPEICTDTSLLSDIPLHRDNLVSSCEGKLNHASLVYPINDLITPVSAFNSLGWTASFDIPSMRPPTDDLSSIRLLI